MTKKIIISAPSSKTEGSSEKKKVIVITPKAPRPPVKPRRIA